MFVSPAPAAPQALRCDMHKQTYTRYCRMDLLDLGMDNYIEVKPAACAAGRHLA